MFFLSMIPTEPEEGSAQAEIEARQRREAEAERRLTQKPSALKSLWERFDVFIIGCAVLGGILIAVVAGVLFTTLRNNEPVLALPGKAAQPTYSPTYIAVNTDQFDTFTVYWDRALWEAGISGPLQIEDFEGIPSDYGVLDFPYLTPQGFYVTGNASAQIFTDSTLMDTGNVFHFRFGTRGLTFHFPDDQTVSAFGFDYRPSETWQMTIGHDEVELPGQRQGFLGVIAADGSTLSDFTLISEEYAQGGISLDNIAYIPAD